MRVTMQDWRAVLRGMGMLRAPAYRQPKNTKWKATEKREKETHVELLDVGALGVRSGHDSCADDLDGARAAPVAASHLRV